MWKKRLKAWYACSKAKFVSYGKHKTHNMYSIYNISHYIYRAGHKSTSSQSAENAKKCTEHTEGRSLNHCSAGSPAWPSSTMPALRWFIQSCRSDECGPFLGQWTMWHCCSEWGNRERRPQFSDTHMRTHQHHNLPRPPNAAGLPQHFECKCSVSSFSVPY